MTTSTAGIQRNKLFWGSCLALLTTAFCFTVITAIQTDVQREFLMSNTQMGWFRGLFFGGFVAAQVIFSPFCDIIGMRPIVRGAFITHVGGALMMMFAPNEVVLIGGSFMAGLGAGLIEAGCNPLVVALYPEKKTEKLNIFHMWFPYGNVIGALLVLGIGGLAVMLNMGVSWNMNLLLILIPALAYGYIMWPAKYPETEGVAAGVSTMDMLKACFTSPIMLLMLAMMFITASLELPATGWIIPILEAGGNVDGILIFAFIFGIMGTLRLLAGPVEKRLRPSGILFLGAILSTIGLYLFAQSQSVLMLFLTAAIWAAGIAYFWPTMLGYVSERNPKSGALGLGLMGAMGMGASFLMTPIIGSQTDTLGFPEISPEVAERVLEESQSSFATVSAEGDAGEVLSEAQTAINEALAGLAADGELPGAATISALRAIRKAGDYTETSGAVAGVQNDVNEMLNSVDSVGGRGAFGRLSMLGIILIVVFGVLLLRDRSKGGYQQEHLVATGEPEESAAATAT